LSLLGRQATSLSWRRYSFVGGWFD